MNKSVQSLALILSVICLPLTGQSGNTPAIVTSSANEGSRAIVSDGFAAPLYVSRQDWPGVRRAMGDLQNDINRVTGVLPDLITTSRVPRADFVIIAGTIGRSPVIEDLITKGKIDVKDIKDRWESYLIQTVEKPFPGVKNALIIAGSDRRGTIYGIYEISRQAGVSPWYWWADVPARKSEELYVNSGRHIWGEPSVKYRGIFLNDEYPALTRWVAYRYGNVTPSVNPPVPPGVANYNSEFYSRIFEVLLRLKANYLWPAMWNNAFNEDDQRNAALADEYGIVMGTSHQEPMLRAQKEWDRRYQATLGSWSWTNHSDTLVKFWREGIVRNRNFESILTIGLRGADDTEMEPGGPAANIARLEEIVSVQRKMIASELNPDVSKVPQMWCLYKEVQDYYREGMRVPEDVTLLWAEDNWGNVRRLPSAEERSRRGGAGVYYHFDYHGGPRSYQWINTSPLPKIWDQMTLAKQYGADRIWIVNVGHFRGYEIPAEFFLSLAWDNGICNVDEIGAWTEQWASGVFGPDHAVDIAGIIRQYTQFNGRRKPELLSPFTYSLFNYNEAERIVKEYNDIAARAETIGKLLPEELQDAYFHLVLFPVKASDLVNELYVTAGRNALYAQQGRANASEMADRTIELFAADTALMGYYNRVYADGRWRHFMDQSHLGYIAWNDPPENSLRHIRLESPSVPPGAIPAVAVEGSPDSWPSVTEESATTPAGAISGNPASVSGPLPSLPPFDIFNRQTGYFEIFNRGNEPFQYRVTTDKPWILLSDTAGTIHSQQRINVSIDWDVILQGSHQDSASPARQALRHNPHGDSASPARQTFQGSRHGGTSFTDPLNLNQGSRQDFPSSDSLSVSSDKYRGSVTVTAAGRVIQIGITAFCPSIPDAETLDGFVETDGYVSMEAGNYSERYDTGERRWEWIEDYGRTGSGMRATAVTDAPSAVTGLNSPALGYRIYFFSKGEFETVLHMAPSLNFLPGRDFKIGLSIDDCEPQLLTVVPAEFNAENGNREWEQTVMNSTRYVKGKIMVEEPGYHTLRVWMIDPGMVLEKIVVNTGGLRPSYLGPPESYFRH